MLTFRNASVNDWALDLLRSDDRSNNNNTVIKHYGRRMVLDSDVPSDGLVEYFGGPDRVANVETDLVAMSSSDSLVYSASWSDSLVYSASSVLLSNRTSDDEALLLSTLFARSWNLNESEPYALHIQSLRSATDGAAVVAVLDTGLSAFAPEGGYSFVTADGAQRGPDFADPGGCPMDNWHGTAVASVLKAVAPGSRLAAYRVLDPCGVGYASDVADAVVWAAGGRINGLADNAALRAHVISMSFSGEGPCPSYLQSAVTQALGLGATVFAAAGNAARDARLFFPGNCEGVISLGASTRGGALAGYSNWNADFSAPGGDAADPISVLTVGHGRLVLGTATGTSFAVPHAGGLFSLLMGAGIESRAVLDYFGVSDEGGIRTLLGVGSFARNNWTNYTETSAQFNDSLVVASAVTCSAQDFDSSDPYEPYSGEHNYRTYCNPGNFIYGLISKFRWVEPFFFLVGIQFRCMSVTGIVDPTVYEIRSNYFYSASSNVGSASTENINGYSSWASTLRGASAVSNTYRISYWFGDYGSPQTCPGEYRIVGLHGWFGDGVDQANVLCRRPCVCPAGTYNSLGTCTPCNMACNGGEYHTPCGGNSAGECVPCTTCGPGYTVSGCGGSSAGTCSQCGAIALGSYFTTGGSCATSVCGAGSYSSSTFSTSCDSCGSKAYSLAGSSSCKCNAGYFQYPTCWTCTAGYECSSNTQSACTAGKYSKEGASACTRCLAGMYSSGSASQSCSFCAAGTYSLEGAAACIACTSGQYSGSSPSTACVSCDAGKYNGVSSATQCQSCVPGTYSAAGAAACTACSPGQYSWDSAATTCTLCEPGKYNGLSSISQCQSCSPGTYSLVGAQSCVSCSPGYYNPFSQSTSQGACLPCASGSYASGPGFTGCTPCSPGTASGSVGLSTACPSCTAGTNFATNPGSSQCTPCSIVSCNAGFEKQDCITTTNTRCTVCAGIPLCTYTAGTRCNNADGTPTCACAAGYQLVSRACQLCGTGKYKDVGDTSVCKSWTTASCPSLNTYLVNGNAFSNSGCMPCPAAIPDNSAVVTSTRCGWACNAGFNNNN